MTDPVVIVWCCFYMNRTNWCSSLLLITIDGEGDEKYAQMLHVPHKLYKKFTLNITADVVCVCFDGVYTLLSSS